MSIYAVAIMVKPLFRVALGYSAAAAPGATGLFWGPWSLDMRQQSVQLEPAPKPLRVGWYSLKRGCPSLSYRPSGVVYCSLIDQHTG